MHVARVAALTALIAASSAWAASPPEPGRYLADIFVAEVHGAECPDRQGDYYNGVARYRGFNADRVEIRIPVVFDGYSVIDVQTLRITSGAGTLTPRGDFSARLTAPIDRGITGSFEAKLTLDDPEAFRVNLVEMAPLIHCIERFRIALVRSG